MICKIIPIKQSKGIQDCWEYITDENKVLSVQKRDGKLIKTTIDTSLIDMTAEEYIMAKMDFNTVLAYMDNDEKTHRVENIHEKFVSGYMCTPETAVQEFMDVKEQNLYKQNKTLDEETGNYAYHIIQSFPEDLDISDAEVHQCGRELCEKLGLYQAVICSHVHPVINEEGEVSGKCKHNHILINSHIHPDKLDPEKPNRFKYNDNLATYAQLQKWNDEIALEHGLPIIRDPETDKRYSWFKSNEENKGSSWTAQVARDVKNTMRFCKNWEEFKEQMIKQGYHIRETEKTITYYTPEHTETHKQQIREKRLGKEYTKEALEQYWATIDKAMGEIATSENVNSKAPIIAALLEQYNGDLFAEVLVKNKYNSYYLDIQLKNPRRELTAETLHTYFDADKTYQLSTSDHNPIAEVTGQDIFDYYESLKKKREQEQDKKELDPDKQRYYFIETKLDTKTNRPHRISLWDSTGRKRTTIELVCILAMTIIKKEHPTETPAPGRNPAIKAQTSTGKYIYAKKDWKLQNMYDTMVEAREMNLEGPKDIERKLERAGKEIARKRKQVNSLTEKFNQISTIKDAVDRYESIKDICEEIYKMPDGEEKDAAIALHSTELEQYKASVRYLHTKNINVPERFDQLADFKERYESMSNHLNEVKEDLKLINEEYRKLKKIEYNITIAQNDYYCYGPEFDLPPMEKEETNKTNDDTKNINLE